MKRRPKELIASVDGDLSLQKARIAVLWHLGRRGVDPDEAEDVVQEALLRTTDGGDPARGLFVTVPWLKTAAWRIAIDRFRRMRGKSLTDDLPLAAPDAEADEIVARKEDLARLAEAMDTLDGTDRRILDLFYRDAMTIDAIAHRLGLGTEAVKSRLHRARRRLAEIMEH